MTRKLESKTKVCAEIPVQLITDNAVAKVGSHSQVDSLSKRKQAEEPLYLRRL